MTAKVELLTPLGGKVILDPTNTAVDRVLTLPAVAGTVVNNTTLRTELNATGSAPIFSCRAWVNFNGTGTVAIRASGNVSSITDNAVGVYTVNFTTAMPDANYSATSNCSVHVGVQDFVSVQISTHLTTSIALRSNSSSSNFDPAFVSAAIFR